MEIYCGTLRSYFFSVCGFICVMFISLTNISILRLYCSFTNFSHYYHCENTPKGSYSVPSNVKINQSMFMFLGLGKKKNKGGEEVQELSFGSHYLHMGSSRLFPIMLHIMHAPHVNDTNIFRVYGTFKKLIFFLRL